MLKNGEVEVAERVLVAEASEKRAAAHGPDEGRAWRVCALAGAALAVAGWSDVLLIWVPLRFGSSEWEFGTVSTALDAMPLGTIGLALLVMAAMARGWRRRRTALGILAVAVVVGLLASGVLYLLNVPLAWRALSPAGHPTLRKAFVKSGILAATYLVLYGSMAWLTFKKSKPTVGA